MKPEINYYINYINLIKNGKHFGVIMILGHNLKKWALSSYTLKILIAIFIGEMMKCLGFAAK